jgi:hypothetical protein
MDGVWTCEVHRKLTHANGLLGPAGIMVNASPVCVVQSSTTTAGPFSPNAKRQDMNLQLKSVVLDASCSSRAPYFNNTIFLLAIPWSVRI